MPREKIGPSAPRNRYTRAREAIEDGSAAGGVIAGARGAPRKPPFACTSDRLSRFCAAVCFIAELASAIDEADDKYRRGQEGRNLPWTNRSRVHGPHRRHFWHPQRRSARSVERPR